KQQKKETLLAKIDEIGMVFNLDLVESPQDKIKPVILSTLDEIEKMVFEMSEDDAKYILDQLSSFGLS
ncbi:hypothetical protein HY419_00145, partial [candidate division WWE3 bacterium]|nr:hypothetical protein [candidate division WWE3 bacterium]